MCTLVFRQGVRPGGSISGMGTTLLGEHAGCGRSGNGSVIAKRHSHHWGIGFGVAGVDRGEGIMRTVCQGGSGGWSCCSGPGTRGSRRDSGVTNVAENILVFIIFVVSFFCHHPSQRNSSPQKPSRTLHRAQGHRDRRCSTPYLS